MLAHCSFVDPKIFVIKLFLLYYITICRGSSQPRNVNVVTVYDIQNKFIGKILNDYIAEKMCIN